MVLSSMPTAILTVPPTALIGQDLTFQVAFDNTSPTDPGYGPFIDIELPTTGVDGPGGAVDDGISFLSATYLGQPVEAVVVVFNASGVASHPYAVTNTGQPVQITGTPGDQLVVLRLPFGSFTPDQPAAVIDVKASLSPLADLGAPLSIQASGGFQFGDTPLNDYPTDPSILQLPPVTEAVTPKLFTLRKEYIGPENETATGPNFTRQYRVALDIAAGQTVTDLDLTDVLPANLQFVAADATLANGTPVSTTAVATPAVGQTGGTLTRRFASVTGTASDTDAELLFSFFTPRAETSGPAVLSPNTGAPTGSNNDARAQANWQPADPRDPMIVVTSDDTPIDHTLTNRSLAIQKGLRIVTDVGPAGFSPGDVVEYTLDFQVSDFFAFRDLVITDALSDGQRIDATFKPTLAVTEHGATTTGPLAAGSYAFVVDSPGTGQTFGTFRVSSELIARSLDGTLLGGAIPDGGTLGPVAPDTPAFGATTGSLVFRAVIQSTFSDAFPPNDSNVDLGDILGNNVAIEGANLDVQTLAPTGNIVTDTSAVELTIVKGQFEKSIYAINGVVAPSSTLVTAGDLVTYRLRFELPVTAVENLRITDFLPLPVFQAGQVTTFDDLVSGVAPAVGRAQYGPDDTFRALTGLVASVGSDVVSNSVAFVIGSVPSPVSSSSVVDILFTVQATAAPIADALLLTNQGELSYGTTNAGTETSVAIVQVQIAAPALSIANRKGVVATNNASAVFTPLPIGPVSFTAPGTPGFRASGPITSTNLAASPIDSNLRGVDAGDLVTFAFVIENTGSGPNGAFDVAFKDTLPAGFVIPTGGLNLSVTDGTGAAFSTIDLGGGLFGTGLQLVDPGPTATPSGALDPFNPTSGRNLLIVTYDLQVDAAIPSNQALINTVTLTNFASVEGGPDFTTVDPTDTAQVTTAAPSVAKTITGSDQPFTTGNTVAIGEVMTYQVVVVVPEGTTAGATLIDTLDPGLAIVSLDSILASPGLSSSAGSFAAILAAANVTNVGAGDANLGRRVALDLGTLTNTDTDNTTPETITLVYKVGVVNSSDAVRGARLNNSARLAYANGNSTASAPNQTVLEPTLQIDKTIAPATGGGGQTVTVTLVISHTGASNTDAFNVDLTDLVPIGLTPVAGTLLNTAGVAPGTLSLVGNLVTATYSTLALGSTSTLTFQAVINPDLPLFETITNTAGIAYTSLPGDRTTSLSPYNPLVVERTGDPLDPGGSINTYVANDSATVTQNASFVKSIIGTSLDSTTGTNVAIGERIQYRVVGTVPASVTPGVFIRDMLTPGLALVGFDSIVASAGVSTDVPGGFDAVLANAVISAGGPSFELDLGTLTNADTDPITAETITITYTVVVLNTAGNQQGSINGNQAEVRTPLGSLTSSAPDLTVVEPVIGVTKDASPTPTDAGAVVTFTVVVAHEPGSTADAYDLLITDPLPSTLDPIAGSLVVVSGAVPTSVEIVGQLIRVRYDRFALGASTTLQYQARPNATTTPGQTITNTASLTYTSLPSDQTTPSSPYNPLSVERTGDPNGPGGASNNYANNATDSIVLHVNSLAGVVFADANNDGIQGPGEPGIPGVTVTLTGTDTLGLPVMIVLITGPDGSFQFDTLRPGTYAIKETQPPDYVDGIDMAGSLGGTVQNDLITDIDIPAGTSSNGVGYTFGERPAVDLSLTKAVNNAQPSVGDDVLFTVVVRNAGPNIATGVVVTDALPAGLTFVGVMPSQGTYDAATGSWSVGTLPIGGSAMLTLAARVDAPTARTNIGEITATDLPDLTPGVNDRDQATVTPLPADVTISKTASESIVSPGDVILYTVTLRNLGPGRAPGVVVTDLLPSSVTFVGVDPSQGSYDPATGTWAVGTLENGGTATLVVAARIDEAGAITNTATITGSGAIDPDPTPDSNVDQVSIISGGSLSGTVYVDLNHNGVYDPSFDLGIAGATITLSGVDDRGQSVTRVVQTDAHGFYTVQALRPGNYTLTETQPEGFVDFRDSVGSLGGRLQRPDSITAITLAPGQDGVQYNFGELAPKCARFRATAFVLGQPALRARVEQRRAINPQRFDTNHRELGAFFQSQQPNPPTRLGRLFAQVPDLGTRSLMFVITRLRALLIRS